MKKTILTGVKPTGMAHIGNYLGAIKPALEEVEKRKENADFFFLSQSTMRTLPSKTPPFLKNIFMISPLHGSLLA